MKKVKISEEIKIINQLKFDLKVFPENAENLNKKAISKIYESEKCTSCGTVVSQLDNGLCGYCVYKNQGLK